jgi:hypothetical protein
MEQQIELKQYLEMKYNEFLNHGNLKLNECHRHFNLSLGLIFFSPFTWTVLVLLVQHAFSLTHF